MKHFDPVLVERFRRKPAYMWEDQLKEGGGQGQNQSKSRTFSS